MRPLRIATILLALSLTAIAACSYPIRNQVLPAVDHPEYVWKNLPPGDDTLVIVTASGGGTRAAALEMSVLQAMGQIRLPSGASLAEHIDLLSSVSGGSVTAAYFALYGTQGFATLESDFLRQDGVGTILWTGLNPVGLAELSTPSKERIDLLIDWLDRQLFKNMTFEELIKRSRRPYLILNAADMVEGTPFPFTQYTMDLLCSDLSSLKISTAVAASAAFPVALSPVTLKNYNEPPRACEGQREIGWLKPAGATDWYINPSRVAWQRTAAAYASGQKAYVHLLDGGVADNLGVAEPFRLLTGSDVVPRFANDIGQGRIKRIVVVMVNARSVKTSALDRQQATPGLLDMALGSIDSSIDRATFSTAERLRTLLQTGFQTTADQAARGGNREVAANFRAAASNTEFIAIDFDAIPDDYADCRRNFHAIATSWTLSGQEIDALKLVGGALLGRDIYFSKMLSSLNAQVSEPLPTLEQACQKVPSAAN
jgi:NTE family protein